MKSLTTQYGFGSKALIPMHRISKESNPFPGKIFDRPNGTDVYKGVKIDYSGEAVTPGNFLKVLSGDKAAMAGIGTGRVIEGDEKSHLFVFLIDHGGHQIVGFGDEILYATQLRSTIATMHSQNKYNQLVFFLETCYSGSMFDGLYQPEMKVYAMTATKPKENGNMCYCLYDGPFHGACLAGEFSAGWLGLWDAQPKEKRLSFEETYEYTKNFTRKLQHPEQYGDLQIGSEDLIPNRIGVTPTPAVPCPEHVQTNLATLRYLKLQVSHADDQQSLEKAQSELDLYMKEEEEIAEVKSLLLEIFAKESSDIEEYHQNEVVLPSNPQSRECYQDIVTHFSEHCNITPIRFQEGLRIFANACVMELDIPKLKRGMSAICAHTGH